MDKNINLEKDEFEPYEVGAFSLKVDREECLSDMSEGTIQYVEKKIKYYKDKIDSEIAIRAYAKNEHNNNKNKAQNYAILAIILIVIINVIFWGAGLGEYMSIYAFKAKNISTVSVILIYPLFVILFGITIICIFKAFKIYKSSTMIVDSFSMKSKRWDYVIVESKGREEIYLEEIARLEILLKEMKDEREQLKANYMKIQAERNAENNVKENVNTND